MKSCAIAGCGIGGPVLAALLARDGWKVTVFERAPKLGPAGAGILLQPTGISVLQALGLEGRARELGRVVERLDARTASGRLVWRLNYSDLQRYSGGGLGIHRGALFAILHGAALAAGARVIADCEIESVDGSSFRDARGSRHGPFDLIVIAAGQRSTIRVPEAPARCTRDYPWGAWWTSLPDAHGLFPNVLAQWYRGTRELAGYLPTGWLPGAPDAAPLTSTFWSVRTSQVAADRAAGVDVLREKMIRLVPSAEPVLQELRDFSQLALASYGETLMARWSRGNVVWLGDAAHAMSPHLGQGTNLALLDAAALAQNLRACAGIPAALEKYERQRRRHTSVYQFISRWMMPFFQCSLPGPGLLRDVAMPIACRIPWVRRQMLGVLAGVRAGILGGEIAL